MSLLSIIVCFFSLIWSFCLILNDNQLAIISIGLFSFVICEWMQKKYKQGKV